MKPKSPITGKAENVTVKFYEIHHEHSGPLFEISCPTVRIFTPRPAGLRIFGGRLHFRLKFGDCIIFWVFSIIGALAGDLTSSNTAQDFN